MGRPLRLRAWTRVPLLVYASFLCVFCASTVSSAGFALGQNESASARSQKPGESPSKAKPNSVTDNATKNAPDQPMWDPLRAEQDIEVRSEEHTSELQS